MTMKRMGVLAHPTRPQTAPFAEQIAETLRARGLDVWVFTQWDEHDVRPNVAGTDMVIAIGGDGAMLRAARVCATDNVPVFGINMGHLGFLTEVQQPNDWEKYIDNVLAGKYWIEQRMMVEAVVHREDEVVGRADALNDFVISRGNVTRMIQLDTYIDSEWTTTYNADALVISTATGSTAYALAAGGPILPPELRNILIVPVAPHLSLDRPIVLSEGAMVEIIVTSELHSDPILSADGALLCDLLPNDRIVIQASDLISRFVRLRERNYFYRSLLDRLEPRIPVPARRSRQPMTSIDE
jgi:NAD+ kinase